MSAISPVHAGPPAAPPVNPPGGRVKLFGLLTAPLALVAIVAMPAVAGLPAAGQVMLGVLAFAVLVWMKRSTTQ